MKKTTSILLACIVFCGVPLLTGCNKTIFDGNRNSEIRFSVVANGPATKTEYGSVSNGKQALNWVSGDIIRVTSPTAIVTSTTDKHDADYVVTLSDNGQGVPSYGTISHFDSKNSGRTDDENGLAWGDDSKYTFYGIYPSPVTKIGESSYVPIALTKDGSITATLPGETPWSSTTTKTATETVNNEVMTYTYTVYQPEMNYAYMTAVAADVSKGTDFQLKFDPAFTAFEINLTSADDDFIVSEVKLIGAVDNENEIDDRLSGSFTMTAGNLTSATPAQGTASTNAVAVKLPAATTANVTTNTGVCVTLFALPVTNEGTVNLVVTTNSGTATLPLTRKVVGDNNATSYIPYEFKAGQKYNINLLKIGGQWKYQITLEPTALDWDQIINSTTYADQIQAGTTEITGMKETENNYLSNDTSLDAAYAAAEDKAAFIREHSGYNPQYFNVRTLKTDTDDPYFEMIIYPKAPQGGYWMLAPQMEDEGFRIVVWDEDSHEDDPEHYTGDSDLWGQIMNSPVTLHIYPEKPLSEMDRSKAYTLYFNAIFATDRDFENYYNADTEVQDAHGDGTFSYWYFVIEAL